MWTVKNKSSFENPRLFMKEHLKMRLSFTWRFWLQGFVWLLKSVRPCASDLVSLSLSLLICIMQVLTLCLATRRLSTDAHVFAFPQKSGKIPGYGRILRPPISYTLVHSPSLSTVGRPVKMMEYHSHDLVIKQLSQ